MPEYAQAGGWGALGQGLREIGRILAERRMRDEDMKLREGERLVDQFGKIGVGGMTPERIREGLAQPPAQTRVLGGEEFPAIQGMSSPQPLTTNLGAPQGEFGLPAPAKVQGTPPPPPLEEPEPMITAPTAEGMTGPPNLMQAIEKASAKPGVGPRALEGFEGYFAPPPGDLSYLARVYGTQEAAKGRQATIAAGDRRTAAQIAAAAARQEDQQRFLMTENPDRHVRKELIPGPDGKMKAYWVVEDLTTGKKEIKGRAEENWASFIGEYGTGPQQQAALAAAPMIEAVPRMQQFELTNPKAADVASAFLQTVEAVGGTPVLGNVLKSVTDKYGSQFMDSEAQRYLTDAYNYLTATLRPYGAALTAHEIIQGMRGKFIVPGEADESKKNKRRFRSIDLLALIHKAGPSWSGVPVAQLEQALGVSLGQLPPGYQPPAWIGGLGAPMPQVEQAGGTGGTTSNVRRPKY